MLINTHTGHILDIENAKVGQILEFEAGNYVFIDRQEPVGATEPDQN